MGWMDWISTARSPAAEGTPLEDAAPEASSVETKRLPVIDTDACQGCGLCVQACEPSCLEMIWAFATLVDAATCTGCGECAAVCETDVIVMARLPAGGPPLKKAS